MQNAAAPRRRSVRREREQREHERKRGEVRAWPNSEPSGERAESGAGETPAAERGVERGQDWTPVHPLEREALGVRRDVDRTEARTEAEERGGKRSQAACERGGEERGCTSQ